jgi:CzcA family heavy metal efflux pump
MKSLVGRFAVRHTVSILFLVVAVCVAGAYAALRMPSSVFPQTDFPRIIIIVDNGVMPADEMMATVTRPVEEAMKDINGCTSIRSSTGRGTAEIDLFFDWDVDMPRAELYALGRLGQIRSSLPATATADVYRMTFAVFPIIGISLTGPPVKEGGDPTRVWETARYAIKPKLLRIPEVARVDLVGGQAPEYTVMVDPLRLAALHLDFNKVTQALTRNNLVAPAGMHQEDHSLFLTVVDGRLHSAKDIENLAIATGGGHIVRIGDFATVRRGPEPTLQAVTADGTDAVLLNIFSQPGGSTMAIAQALNAQLPEIRRQLPPGMKLTTFYDQSLLVRASVRSAWEAIAFGLILSIAIVYFFLKDWAMTAVATLVIPITVLFTILGMRLLGQSFNLMTLGGIAAAIGLVIDDAIVVVEAIFTRMASGVPRREVVESAVAEILPPLLGSTLTPVVVFIPLAFLTGIAGVFFRALAITMVMALLTSLLLALTVTPSLAAWFIGVSKKEPSPSPSPEFGPVWRGVLILYELTLRLALGNRLFTLGICLLVLASSIALYFRLESDFLPAMDEGGFVIDYIAPPGTSLTESDRQMRQAERIIRSIPEIESYSRRTGAGLGVHLVEPNTGDFLVKLKENRKRSSEAVIADLRTQLTGALPRIDWEFPGILTDLIGDLATYTDSPIEVKLISNDLDFLKSKAPDVEAQLRRVSGVVDTFSGLVYTGPSISFRVREADAQRYGLNTADIAAAANTAMLGTNASTVLETDRVLNVRVCADPASIARLEMLRRLPLRAADGTIIRIDQVADVIQIPGQLELERDDLRQDVSVTASLEGRDLGSAMKEIQAMLGHDPGLPAGTVEYGGLYQQQQESFHNLLLVLGTAIVLVFLVALLEFGSFREPIAIVFGAVLSVFGIVVALLVTHTTLNIVALLGAIIGMGIVHKNGLLMLDSVKSLRRAGLPLREALIQSGGRRLRPVLMTSLAAALGMLPLACGVGAADMLRPLGIAVIGALCISVLLSLVATPTVYDLLARRDDWGGFNRQDAKDAKGKSD